MNINNLGDRLTVGQRPLKPLILVRFQVPQPTNEVNLRYYSPMIKKSIAGGVVHVMPKDLRKALTGAPAARAVWEDITSLARNEWICWVTSGKKAKTRSIRIEKALSKLKGGMRRPCCWAGCPHR